MAKFVKPGRSDSKGPRSSSSRSSSPRSSSRDKDSDYRDFRRRGQSGGRKDFKRNSRRDNIMTKVTCSSCGCECKVPFKPTSNKPVYCDDCFSKTGNSKPTIKDFDLINEKLDKIIKALKIK